jgi:hypothetical protein
MIISIQLVPYTGTVSLNLFDKAVPPAAPDTTPVNGSPIVGSTVANRPGLYRFDLDTIPPGDYEVTTLGVLGAFVLELGATTYKLGDTWDQLAATSPTLSITLSPEYFLNQEDVTEANELVFYNNESRTITINNPDGNFDGSTMEFVIEKEDKTNLVLVTGLTSVTNSVAVTIPATAPQTCPCLSWSLRKSTGKLVILSGAAIQRYAAYNDT